MSEKFNELIELIISEENDQAKALFHEIIVDKSRSIYESLIDEEEVDEDAEVVDESDEDLEESDFDEELGGDEPEALIADISADEEGLTLEDEHEDEEMEDRVVDLEDALDELKAEFEKIMGDDAGEDDMEMDPEMDMDMEPEMEMDPEEEEMEEAEEVDETVVSEYTEKVAHPSNSEEGEKASGPVGNAKSKPHNGEAKAAMSPGTAETGMTPPKAAKQTKVAGNVNAKQSKV